jgi:hypothetical protein
MEAQRLTDSRVRFLVSIAGFDLLVALLAEAKSELWNKEEFPTRVGITSEEYESLQDELDLVRYGPLGYPRPRDSQTGGPWGPTEPRRTGTAWDNLPKMEVLADGRVALTLARGELAIFANAVEAALDKLAPTRSGWGASEFQSRQGLRVGEAEDLISELRRLDRETRGESSG